MDSYLLQTLLGGVIPPTYSSTNTERPRFPAVNTPRNQRGRMEDAAPPPPLLSNSIWHSRAMALATYSQQQQEPPQNDGNGIFRPSPPLVLLNLLLEGPTLSPTTTASSITATLSALTSVFQVSQALGAEIRAAALERELPPPPLYRKHRTTTAVTFSWN